MIRSLVESGLSRLDLQESEREQLVDAVTRLIGDAADQAVRDLVEGRVSVGSPAQPPSDGVTDRKPRGARRGRTGGAAPRDAEASAEDGPS